MKTEVWLLRSRSRECLIPAIAFISTSILRVPPSVDSAGVPDACGTGGSSTCISLFLSPLEAALWAVMFAVVSGIRLIVFIGENGCDSVQSS